MAQLIYKYGAKAKYLSLTERSNDTLYFCTDTCELFKGNDLYTDGIRQVDNFASLPIFTQAADGKLYYCKDTGCGYVLNETHNGWVQVIHGIDNRTIGIDNDGLMYVKAVSMDAVLGLQDKLNAITNKIGTCSVKVVEFLTDLPLVGSVDSLYVTRSPVGMYVWNAETHTYDIVNGATEEIINEAIHTANTYTDVKVAEIIKASSYEIIEF